MSAKNIITIVLLLFVGFSLGYVVFKEAVERSEPVEEVGPVVEEPAAGDEVVVGEGERQVVVYYFHGSKRCVTCKKLEAYSDEAVKSGFGEELKEGVLEWRVVNTDEPENAHFLKDYQLITKSVVVVEMVDGKQKRWRNLKKIWQLVGDKDEFVAYVQGGVREYLEGS